MRPDRERPALIPTLLRNVLPAYAVPAVATFANAQVIPDAEFAQRIEAASYTTIAIPSAAASAAVTVWLIRRTPPPATAASRRRAFLTAGLACSAVAAMLSAVLIGNGLQAPSLLQFALPAAFMGGGLAARAWARSRRAEPLPARAAGRAPSHPADRVTAGAGCPTGGGMAR